MSEQTPPKKKSFLQRIFFRFSIKVRNSSTRSTFVSSTSLQRSSSVAAIKMSPMDTFKGTEKLAAVTELMDKLAKDLDSISLLPHQRDLILEQIKVYGRDPQYADPIFTEKGIETLARHAFHSPSTVTSRNALRVLCNAMLLKPATRQIFVNLNFQAKACEQLKRDNRDDEFLISRVIFLTTYANADLEELIDKYHLADIISKNLERHAKHHQSATDKYTVEPMEEMALTETLKLLFNISHYCKDRTSSFTPAIPHIVTILCHGPYRPPKPLDSPVVNLVNALLNLDLGSTDIQTSLYPETEPTVLANRLVDLLDRSSKVYNDEQVEATVTALVGVLRAVHEYAPATVKISIREQLLPTEEDRNLTLGKTDSLASWLLRNSLNPVTPQLREAISDLLFDLSDKDSSQFVKNVGYGFASGFLFSRNLPIPQNASEAYANANVSNRPVNPVTGQFLDAERHPEMPEMTQDEMEREAERLFVLFERLRANGVISAENPVRTAQEQGRFEELPEDHEDVD